MTLAETQALFHEVLTGAGPVAPGRIDACFAGTPELPAVERVAIYAGMYRWRLVEALRETFPNLVRFLGDESFAALAEDYLRRHPSEHHDVGQVGRRLAAFLREYPDPERPDLADLAELEWARQQVFFAPPAEPVGAEALAGLEAEAFSRSGLVLSPALQVLVLAHAATPLWRRLEDGEPPDSALAGPLGRGGLAERLRGLPRRADARRGRGARGGPVGRLAGHHLRGLRRPGRCGHRGARRALELARRGLDRVRGPGPSCKLTRPGMLTCKEITALATDYSEGHLGPAERARFDAHVARCAACTAWTRQLQAAARAVGRLPAPSVPLEQRAALLARFDEWAAGRSAPEVVGGGRSGGRRSGAVVAALATLAVFGGVVAMARHPSHLPLDLGIAGVLVAVATVLAALGRRVTFGSAAVAVSAGLGAALLAGRGGALELSTGLECLLVLGMASAGSAGATWGWLRREPAERRRHAAGSSAVAGALAGVAALQLACGAHASLVHLMTFHVGGLLAMAAAALLASRPRTPRAGQGG